MATGKDTVCTSSNGISSRLLPFISHYSDSFTTRENGFYKTSTFPHSSNPLSNFRCTPSLISHAPYGARQLPPGGSQGGSVRIRLGAFQMVFCVPRLTPPARCAVLSFALSGCTPSRTATPAKPFRGAFLAAPFGGSAAKRQRG